jgi:hypothetical protein
VRGWRCSIVVAIFFVLSAVVLSFAASASDPVVAKAEKLFGPALKTGDSVFAFRFNDSYVLWLIFEGGALSEVDLGTKSYYASEFPGTKGSKEREYLSPLEYEDALQKISQLRAIGRLRESHRAAFETDFGSVNTDRFDLAFVDRVVAKTGDENVVKLNAYFLEVSQGSPEQIEAEDDHFVVCMGGLWYYLPADEAKTIQLGRWIKLHLAGPSLRGHVGCNRTVPIYDADGFTIENPSNETIAFPNLTVGSLSGTVHLSHGGNPIKDVNVEALLVGDESVLRTKTDAQGAFVFSRLREGKYKFKVSKDGFKSISGFVILDHKACTKLLSFELPVGT